MSSDRSRHWFHAPWITWPVLLLCFGLGAVRITHLAPSDLESAWLIHLNEVLQGRVAWQAGDGLWVRTLGLLFPSGLPLAALFGFRWLALVGFLVFSLVLSDLFRRRSLPPLLVPASLCLGVWMPWGPGLLLAHAPVLWALVFLSVAYWVRNGRETAGRAVIAGLLWGLVAWWYPPLWPLVTLGLPWLVRMRPEFRRHAFYPALVLLVGLIGPIVMLGPGHIPVWPHVFPEGSRLVEHLLHVLTSAPVLAAFVLAALLDGVALNRNPSAALTWVSLPIIGSALCLCFRLSEVLWMSMVLLLAWPLATILALRFALALGRWRLSVVILFVLLAHAVLWRSEIAAASRGLIEHVGLLRTVAEHLAPTDTLYDETASVYFHRGRPLNLDVSPDAAMEWIAKGHKAGGDLHVLWVCGPEPAQTPVLFGFKSVLNSNLRLWRWPGTNAGETP